MTMIEEVFGSTKNVSPLANGCWQFKGKAKRARDEHRKIATDYARNEPTGRQLAICEFHDCLNPDHYSDSQSPEARMLWIKQHTRKSGDCLVWTAQVNDVGAPIIPVRKEGRKGHSYLSVQRFVWQQEYRRYDKGGVKKMSCGRVDCVNHRHIEFIERPADGKCPEGHQLQATNVLYCHQCEKDKTPTTCENGHVLEGDEASKAGQYGCLDCRRDIASEFIKARNNEALKAGRI